MIPSAKFVARVAVVWADLAISIKRHRSRVSPVCNGRRLPLKTPYRFWRTSARPQRLSRLYSTHVSGLHAPLPGIMSKTKAQAEIQSPAKWQLVSWQKKDQQYGRVPHEWRLKSLPSAGVTNYINIPRTCGLFTKEELHITEDYDATALAKAIRDRKLKCVDVTNAFCKVSSLQDNRTLH
jgi:hypothetical protein